MAKAVRVIVTRKRASQRPPTKAVTAIVPTARL
jgi:hypothetical protein